MAQFRNALKHVLSVKHMNACVEACAEAGSESGLYQTNKTNSFWKLTRIQAAQSFEQSSSLFPLASANDGVFLGRLLFCRTKHTHGLQGGGGGSGSTLSASRQPSRQRAVRRTSILPGLGGAVGGSSFTILTREV